MGHKNMALKRGYDVEIHDALIVRNWNKVVSKRDKVFILGDLTMEKGDYSFLDMLNGTKEIILGNHDLSQHVPKMLECKSVTKVGGCVKYKGYMLSHIPIHTCEIERFKGNIHGHVHENTLDDDRYYNMSCENVNFTPQLFDDVINRKWNT